MVAKTQKPKPAQMDLLGDADSLTQKRLQQQDRQDEKYSREQGRGLELVYQAEKFYPGQPLKQVNHFFSKFVIPAGTGRARSVGIMTTKEYVQRMTSVIKTLQAQNIRVARLSELTGKQMRRVMEVWEAQGLSASTLSNRNTVMRRFGIWIGKPGLVPYSHELVKDPDSVRRRQSAETSKSWESAGIDPEKVIAQVGEVCPATALHLQLQHKFGLRVSESLCFRPFESDEGTHIVVRRGTKGGRTREVPVETPLQRTILETAKLFVDKARKQSPGPRSWSGQGYIAAQPYYKLHQANRHFRHIMEQCNITGPGMGVTAHGLRHSYAQAKFQRLTGELAPVAGGKKLDHGKEIAARLEVTEALGHGRETATAAYLGTHQHLSRVAWQNLRKLDKTIRGSAELVELCQGLGIESITVLGDPAEGKTTARGRDVNFVLSDTAGGQEPAIRTLLSSLTGWRVYLVTQAQVSGDIPTFEIPIAHLTLPI